MIKMKKFPLYIFLLLLLTCAKEDSQAPNTPPTQIVKQYTLTASAGDGGSVTGGGTFASGTQVSVTATPSSGYSFTGWSNGSTTNTLLITLNSNTTITANFQVIVNTYTLTVSAGEGGSVSTEGGEYEEGTELTITATPYEGYEFIGWSDGSTEESITITLNSDLNTEATFQRLFFTSLSENYSSINQSTGYYSKTSNFKRYISLDEARYLRNTTGYYFSNFDAITYDFNQDGFLDLFWFGMNSSIWEGGGHENGKYFFISDYFGNNAPYEIIEFPSSIEFLAGGIDLQDINNDGSKEVILYSTNVHQNEYFGSGADPNFIGDNSNPAEELGVIILYLDNNFNIIQEIEVGTPKTLHRGTSGDIDNDGDIDILNWQTGHPINQSLYEKFPTILYNDGAGNFIEEFIFKDNSLQEYQVNYWSIDSVSNNFFDIDGDGNLDLISGITIGTPRPPNLCCNVNFFEPKHAFVLWGDGSGKFEYENRSELEILNDLGYDQTLLGMGFTDFDQDGDIDIILQATRTEEGGLQTDRPATMYMSYILNLLENKGNRVFEDVTYLIDGNSSIEVEHLGDMGEMMIIDKDGDGDFDIVPKDVKVFCCLGPEFNFVSNLYWENVGGSYIRRINNY